MLIRTILYSVVMSAALIVGAWAYVPSGRVPHKITPQTEFPTLIGWCCQSRFSIVVVDEHRVCYEISTAGEELWYVEIPCPFHFGPLNNRLPGQVDSICTDELTRP